MLGDGVFYHLLPLLGAHVFVGRGIAYAGQLSGRLGHALNVDDAGDIRAAVADKYSCSAHLCAAAFLRVWSMRLKAG